MCYVFAYMYLLFIILTSIWRAYIIIIVKISLKNQTAPFWNTRRELFSRHIIIKVGGFYLLADSRILVRKQALA